MYHRTTSVRNTCIFSSLQYYEVLATLSIVHTIIEYAQGSRLTQSINVLEYLKVHLRQVWGLRTKFEQFGGIFFFLD